MEHLKELLLGLAVIGYNIFLVGGTAYLVVVYDWSPWTFLATLLFLTSFKTKKDNKDTE